MAQGVMDDEDAEIIGIKSIHFSNAFFDVVQTRYPALETTLDDDYIVLSNLPKQNLIFLDTDLHPNEDYSLLNFEITGSSKILRKGRKSRNFRRGGPDTIMLSIDAARPRVREHSTACVKLRHLTNFKASTKLNERQMLEQLDPDDEALKSMYPDPNWPVSKEMQEKLGLGVGAKDVWIH